MYIHVLCQIQAGCGGGDSNCYSSGKPTPEIKIQGITAPNRFIAAQWPYVTCPIIIF